MTTTSPSNRQAFTLVELMVVISHARAKIMNVETATLPALTEALPPDVVLAAAAVKGLELDTAVYQFDDSDLTEMIREGAIAELASLEKYKVYKGDFCTWNEVQVEAQNAPDGEDYRTDHRSIFIYNADVDR